MQEKGVFIVPKKVSNKRKRYRENKKRAKKEKWLEKQREEKLSRQNEFGIQDPTPFEAVSIMIDKERGKINER